MLPVLRRGRGILSISLVPDGFYLQFLMLIVLVAITGRSAIAVLV